MKTVKEKTLDSWIDSIDLDPVECDELNEYMIWGTHKPDLWKAKHFVGMPTYLPVYRWRDYYSYSPLTLLLKKGALDLNHRVVKKTAVFEKVNYLSESQTIDKDIVRLGGTMWPRFKTRTPEDFARNIAEAMQGDVAQVEAKNPGYTNAVLCGGKDSLNMLLLPWKNPVIVYSAYPNYPLVKQYMKDNNLPFKVYPLEDDDLTALPIEILTNFCRNNLEHCRWGPLQMRIAEEHDHKVIFWKGVMGGMFMTSGWATYTNPPYSDWPQIKKICSLWGGRGEYWAKRNLKKIGATQLRTFKTYWDRGAMWQGAHLSMQRQYSGALTISPYHGPKMKEVVKNVDLNKSVIDDVRPRIGEILYGKVVKYPATNPSPPANTIRHGYSTADHFVDTLKCLGFQINNMSGHMFRKAKA